MATEVEIKAWVEDPDAVRSLLAEKAVFVKTFVKEDTYFCRTAENGNKRALSEDENLRESESRKEAEGEEKKIESSSRTRFSSGARSDRSLFRLRRENGRSVVTYKEKEREGGTEINQEYEFTVSDPAAFYYFAEGIGFTSCIHKRKEGELFHWNEANVELSHVDGLGWFIEIECIVETETGTEKAKKKIYSVFNELGIESERIEDRYYIDML